MRFGGTLLCWVISVACVGMPVSAAGANAAAGPSRANLVLRNGVIFTGDAGGSTVQALAVRDGRVSALGSNQEMSQWVGPDTEVMDLKGKFAIPGLNDIHVHVQAAARDLAAYNCWFSQYSTFEQVLAAVKDCALKVKPGDWVIGTYWNSRLYSRLEKADAIKALDAASGGHPVLLRNDTIHDRWANSRALQLAGITARTPNPLNGVIGRDPANGELNGLLIEGPAIALVERVSPLNEAAADAPSSSARGATSPGNDRRLEQLRLGVSKLSSYGVTAFEDAAVLGTDVGLWRALDEQGDLRARATLCILVDPNQPGDLESLFADAQRQETAHVKARCAKIFWMA